jgi:L-fuculose-phosphate aldolase
MPKIIYTDHDIEDLVRQGITTLTVGEDMVLTDLAYEKAGRLGINLVYSGSENPPSAPVRPYLSPKILAKANQYLAHFVNSPPAQDHSNLLRFSSAASEADLRAAIIETGKIAYQTGLMISNDGNISVRMPDGLILITPAGVCKGRINPEDLLVIDINGNLIKTAADPSMKPSSEQPMHLEVYRQRPDVCAVIHTHLIFANALVISKGKIRMDVIPEAAAAFGSVPVTVYSMPSSVQNAEAIRELISTHDVILIRNHGCLAVGKDLDSALIHVERLEHISKTLTFAELLGDVKSLPPELIESIIQAAR